MMRGILYSGYLYLGGIAGYFIADFAGAAFGIAIACFIISGTDS
jgi:hypothetical protein